MRGDETRHDAGLWPDDEGDAGETVRQFLLGVAVATGTTLALIRLVRWWQTPAPEPQPRGARTGLLAAPPAGLLRRALRLPVALYQRDLGWLLDNRFLMVTHRGRKTGRVYHTVLEVLRYDPDAHEAVVVAAWGPRCDWLRNIEAAPALEVRIGRERFVPTQHVLSADEAAAFYAAWEKAHPIEARVLPRLLGIEGYDRSDAARRRLVERVRFVSFRPRGSTPATTPPAAQG